VHGLQYSNRQVIQYVEQVRRRYLKELTSHTSSEESQP
jgi:hemerythrin superfamily protein